MSYLLNLTRHNEIGANCYYLEHQNTGVVLDAGMHPKLDGHSALPDLEVIDRKPVKAIFVSHAHHDHTGALPLLMERHPDVPVFLSEPTYFLADPLLHNSVNVMKRQRLEAGVQDYPLYTHRDIHQAVGRWQACHFDEEWSLEGYPLAKHLNEKQTFKLHHAGHILGSAAIELNLNGLKTLYTGDINFRDQTLMTAARLPEEQVHLLIIETTRGAQPTADGYSRQHAEEELLKAIQNTFERDGAVLMPIFAMGKTQELLSFLYRAQRRGEIPDHPIHIGGLGKVFSQVYDRLARSSPRALQDLSIFEDIRPQVFDWKQMNKFKPLPGHLYLLPSGMMTRQTTSNRLARHFLNDERHSIFFVGYTDPDSPAGQLRATGKDEKVLLNQDDGPQRIGCEIRHFDFTSHATREDILDFILRTKPLQCALVHGDPDALEWFQKAVQDLAPEINVFIPEPKKEVPL
ncbi:MAG: MBL fold metallo-hydrolase [Verrucomicrobiota bacterium]